MVVVIFVWFLFVIILSSVPSGLLIMVFLISVSVMNWWWNVLLDEQLIRDIIRREQEFMIDMNDSVDRKCCGAFTAGLKCCLND